MSLAARCPWCETVFRLTEGQVSAKGGMARCGVCNHTFNALDALLSDSAVAALERGAQAREANQEATARASEQVASKAAKASPPLISASIPAPSPVSNPIHIPLSIRKIFTGSSTPSAPPVTATPSAVAPGPSVFPAATTFDAVPPEAAPSPATAPAVPSLREQLNAPAPPAEAAPSSTEETQPEARLEPQPAPGPPPAPPPAPPLGPPEDVQHAQPAAAPYQQPKQSEQVPPSAPAPSAVPEAVSEPSDQSPQSAPVPVDTIPVDYKVEMPNYDAERAAALAEAERLQKEQQERHELAQRRQSEQANATVEQQLDELQTALSPASDEQQDEFEARSANTTSATLQSLRLQHAAVQAASKADPVHEEERLGPNTFQPSFLLATPPPARFLRTRRFFGSVLALVLIVGLVAQAAYWWRSDIAMRVPQTRPYLVLVCQRLHCEVEPPAQIDQLSIESSELVAAPGATGGLGFTALIRNHSVNALAYPAIEITLTDAHDQAILRRVFLPDSYLGDAGNVRRLAGIPGNSEYTLKLTFNTSGVLTSGYRAGIFYP